MRCRSNSNRVVEILLLFFSYYIKKAVSQIGNVVITIKPYVMKPATDKLLELYRLIRDNYQGIFTKKDLSTIYFLISNRIDEEIEIEKEQKIL
jgi:hypothetical protein